MNPYIKLPKVPIVYGRHDLILSKCRNKRVLHLGCVDKGLIHERLKYGELMHQKLLSVTKEVWGMDIDDENISFLKSQGFENLITGDICQIDKIDALKEKNFDIILASEVIEHLNNPGLFLNGVKTLMIPGKTELIITVPNAFRIDNLKWLFHGIEYIHPDHNYWFSYHTLTNLLKKNGFEILELYVYIFQPHDILLSWPEKASWKRDFFSIKRVVKYFRLLPRFLISSMLFRRTSFWGDGIIVIVQISDYGY